MHPEQDRPISGPRRYTVELPLEISEEKSARVRSLLPNSDDSAIDMMTHTIARFPALWHGLPMAGVLAIQALVLQGVLIPLLRVGASQALVEEREEEVALEAQEASDARDRSLRKCRGRIKFLTYLIENLDVELVPMDVLAPVAPAPVPPGLDDDEDDEEFDG